MFPYSEPKRVTDPALLEVLEDLRAREPIFHHPEYGTTRADFDGMMTLDFWEVGASGRRYSRESILDELERRYAGEYVDGPLEATDFHCRKLADDVYLLTYTLFQDKRVTRRATIWHRIAVDWKIVFHQGTIVQGEGER
ncbi:MAG TPA: DUF4440 domain-containing protein [Candidatus Eisenbacteria bacterium]|nr:DUF4440 domain-containing protein [Candidatus Eisenbacteria bacterium]